MAKRIRRGRPRLKRTQKISYRREIYRDYVAKKKRALERMEKRDLPVKDPKILSFEGYETYYKDFKKTFPDRSAKQLNSLLVSDQIYRLSEEQYRGAKESLKEYEEFFRVLPSYEKIKGMTREEFRTKQIYTDEDYEVMRQAYHDIKDNLVARGVDKSVAWKLAKQQVGEIYWGGDGTS